MKFGTILSVAAATALVAVTAPAAHAQAANKLLAQAKISEDSARVIARKVVPNATITEGELEQEKGKLIWSFDMKLAGHSGIEEVNVDAITGAVIAHEHENAAAERAEAAGEHHVAKKKDHDRDEKAEHEKSDSSEKHEDADTTKKP